jgi:F0F1-type ATP synthase assembly protein I
VDDLKGRRELYNGFGDSLSRAIELVVTPLLFGLLGLLLDHIFGLTPVLTTALTLFGIAGVSVKMYYAYDRDMQAHEAGAPWAKGRR